MRIDRLELALRPRHPFEAADLGGRLLLRNWRLVYSVWFAVLLPVLALAAYISYRAGNQFGLLLLWWLKPLFDYAVLWVLSQAVFGEKPRLASSLKALWQLPAAGLFGALLIRRFSMGRALVMPVRLLEGLRGAALDQRIRLIRKGYSGRARWLLQVYMMAELSMQLGLISLIGWLSPAFESLGIVFEFLQAGTGSWQQQLVLGFYALSISLIEPFYVASGFLLYLNRRTELEAWDIEVAFRQLAERLQTQDQPPPAAAVHPRGGR